MASEADLETLEAALLANAQKPASVSGDAGSVSQHNPKDMIEVDRYERAKLAADNPGSGFRICRLIPPGTA